MAVSSEHDANSLEAIAKAVARGAEARQRLARRRRLWGLALSGSITVAWAASVTATNQWDRIADQWLAALTMVFGSFVGGATPQGGGAVAFPVFTKALDVPAEAARSFSLCVQAVGMGTASLSIVINRRTVEWRSAIAGAVAGSIAMVATLLTLGDPSKAFWPVDLPGPYVKVTFTIVLLAMAWVVILSRRVPVRSVSERLPPLHARLRAALIVAGAVGGIAAALVGSGVDLMVYLFVVVLFGVRAGVGVPTSVISMAIVSAVGLIMLGLVDRQFVVEIGTDGLVTAIGGEPLSPALPVRQADLFGMWLAAVPVVAWGAPAGSIVAARLSPRSLVVLVVSLAIAETLSTVIFLDELRSDRSLLAFAVVGAALTLGGLTSIANHRQRLFGLPPLSPGTLLTRANVEVAPTYNDHLQ